MAWMPSTYLFILYNIIISFKWKDSELVISLNWTHSIIMWIWIRVYLMKIDKMYGCHWPHIECLKITRCEGQFELKIKITREIFLNSQIDSSRNDLLSMSKTIL